MILYLHDVAMRRRYKKAMKLWHDDVKRSLREVQSLVATHARSKFVNEKLTNEQILLTCESKLRNSNRKSDRSGSDSGDE